MILGGCTWWFFFAEGNQCFHCLSYRETKYHGAEPEERFACQAGHKGYKITQLGMATDVCLGTGKGIKMSGRGGGEGKLVPQEWVEP